MTQTRVFVVERVGTILVITPQGDANGFRYTDIQSETNVLLARIGNDGLTGLVIDFNNTEIIGSIMISALIKLARRVGNGRAVFCRGSETMLETLRAMNLVRLWPHHETREDAMSALLDVSIQG
jgi:anti-anti-sigma regulatory factor